MTLLFILCGHIRVRPLRVLRSMCTRRGGVREGGREGPLGRSPTRSIVRCPTIFQSPIAIAAVMKTSLDRRKKNLSSDEGRAHDSRRLGGPKAVWIHNQMEAAPSSAFPQNNRTVFAQDSGVAKRCISLPIVLEMMIIHDESRFPPLLSRLVSPKTPLHPSLSPPHRSPSLRDSPRPITIGRLQSD